MKPLRTTLEACVQDSPGRLPLWDRILGELRPQTVLEIGVWKGEYAAHILKECDSIRTYYMIDPWRRFPDWNKPFNIADEAFDVIYHEAMEATNFARDKIKVLRDRTVDAVAKIPDQSLDFVYVDSDHSLRGIAIDLVSIWPKVKPGGHVGGDDFTHNIWEHSAEYEPTLVFPFAVYFAEAVHAPIYALPYQQFLIEKPSGAGRHEFIQLAEGYDDRSLRRQMLPDKSWRSVVPEPIKKVARYLRSMIS